MDTIEAPSRQRARRTRFVVEPDDDQPLRGRALERLVRALSAASSASGEEREAEAGGLRPAGGGRDKG